MQSLNAPSLTKEEVTKKIAEYKQENAVACSTPSYGTADALSYLNAANSYPWLYQEQNTFMPFAAAAVQFNTLVIPDTLSGTTFNLRIHDSTKQYLPGTATNTTAFNNNAILGPTLIFKKGTKVQMHVKNDLNDTTTIHWHGMHLPAVMDGGPHQPIKPGTTWNPTWVVKNNSATYWYHPHLHMKTSEQLVQGLAGMIIVRDDAEAALHLPRKYGVDDIPLILNEKRFQSNNNQFVVSHYGDTMMCNGVLNAQYAIPAQVVRFRVLDAAVERCYNIGFSDNRTFSVIASDAGLLAKPVNVKRYLLAAGERIEILVNFTGQASKNVTLRAFNATLPSSIPGGEPNTSGTASNLRNKLGQRDFDILRLNITAQTANPVTIIPASLVKNSSPDSTKAGVTRLITMDRGGTTCSIVDFGCFQFNKKYYDMDRIDYRVQKDAIEIWQITNNTNTSHPFHIHDVSFKILSKSDGALAAYEKGWKDVVLVKKGTTVRFIAQFSDYADSVNPYMYHCHITVHEDAGMMGQFVVMPPPAVSIANATVTEGNSGTRQMNFKVRLSSASTGTVRVQYNTQNGTATSPADYVAQNNTLTFKPGETLKTVSITINGDALAEPNETFRVNLSNPANAVVANSFATGTIKNDDAATLIAKNSAATGLSEKNKVDVFPNPITSTATISFTLMQTQKVAVTIFDLNGIPVKRFADMQLHAGANQLIWNRRDDKGNAIKPGTYFLCFAAEDYTETKKLIVVQ